MMSKTLIIASNCWPLRSALQQKEKMPAAPASTGASTRPLDHAASHSGSDAWPPPLAAVSDTPPGGSTTPAS